MKTKMFILGILLLILVTSVSAELAYKASFELIDDKPEVVYVTVVDVSNDEIARPIIGKYLLVAGNGNEIVNPEGQTEYLDGVFFNLPSVTFVTYVDEDGGLYTETIEEDKTTVYLPYQEEITEFKGFMSDGTEVLSFPAPKEGEIKKFREPSEPIDEHSINEESNILSNEELAEQAIKETDNNEDSGSQNNKAFWFVIIAVIIILTVFIIKKVSRKD